MWPMRGIDALKTTIERRLHQPSLEDGTARLELDKNKLRKKKLRFWNKVIWTDGTSINLEESVKKALFADGVNCTETSCLLRSNRKP